MRNNAFTPVRVFDKFLTQYRYSRVFQALIHYQHIQTIYDLGCGSGNLVRALVDKGYDAYGIDVKCGDRIIAADLNETLPIAADSVDLMISLANIEHLEKPLYNLTEIYRVLKKNGVLMLTTPSKAAKPVLELLAFKFKLIDACEIRDHKRYFSKKMLQEYLILAGFKQFNVKHFQIGMNLHAIAIK